MKNKTGVSFNRSSCKKARVGQWITLESSPTSLTENKALVICKVADNKLVTWVPDYGEYDLICN